MKILLNCHTPFPLAHGGAQIQIEQTKAALEQIGVEVEYLRWWDDQQTGDILHHVGWVPPALIGLARQKGWPTAMTILLTETCNRPRWELFLRKLGVRATRALPGARKDRLPWQTYRQCDQMIVGLEAERWILESVYGVEKERIAVVPLGLSDAFLKAGPATRGADHLICTGTIGPSKNSIELARMATEVRVPILFVGKPFDSTGAYWKEFAGYIDGKIVRHHPHVAGQAELVSLLQQARGYVLMSRYENWSLAAHEAAGCGLPMLLPDQRWARERFGDQAGFFPKHSGARAAALRSFYDRCPSLAAPGVRLYSWVEAAQMLREIYARMLNPSQPRS